jgi:hypothetical protein
MSTRSWREERQNTNSNSQESDNRHQDKHDEDSAVHQMVVPLGLAIFQLVPWFFVIIHREILDWMFLRYVEPFRMQTQKLTAPRRWPLAAARLHVRKSYFVRGFAAIFPLSSRSYHVAVGEVV